jgi:hypothetical protein
MPVLILQVATSNEKGGFGRPRRPESSSSAEGREKELGAVPRRDQRRSDRERGEFNNIPSLTRHGIIGLPASFLLPARRRSSSKPRSALP